MTSPVSCQQMLSNPIIGSDERSHGGGAHEPAGRPADEVWARVVTPAGINDELVPWMRMTVPRAWRGSSLADVEPGTKLGRSWILALGFVPVDYDDLGIAAIGERSFLEQSTMFSARSWQHERWVDPDPPDGTRLPARCATASSSCPAAGSRWCLAACGSIERSSPPFSAIGTADWFGGAASGGGVTGAHRPPLRVGA